MIQTVNDTQDQLEETRKTKQPKGQFSLGKNTEFHTMLMTETPERIARMIEENSKGLGEGKKSSSITAESLLENTPKELWGKIEEVGKVLEQRENKKSSFFMDCIDKFVNAVSSLFRKSMGKLAFASAINEMETVTLGVKTEQKDLSTQPKDKGIVETARERSNSAPTEKTMVEKLNDKRRNSVPNNFVR